MHIALAPPPIGVAPRGRLSCRRSPGGGDGHPRPGGPAYSSLIALASLARSSGEIRSS